jgi:hypothetical protein
VRWLVCLLLAVVGCVASIPDDPSLTADLAAETARMVVQLRHDAPAPTPPSGEACENCGGTGKLGDGRISVPCPICKGTGKS